MPTILNADTVTGGAVITGDASGQLALQAAGVTKLTVSSAGVSIPTLVGSNINLATNVTGTLPIANGGTGTTSTTFANLTTNVTGTLPVGNGGTGAATLTANNVLLGNGTSPLQAVAPGALGNILTSTGSTWQSSAAPAGGSWVWLSTVNAAGTYANVETTFNSTYDVYAITISGARPANDSVDFVMEVKLDGSYRTSSDYKYHLHRMISGNTAYSAAASGGQPNITLATGVEGDRANTLNYIIYVMNPSTTLSAPVYHLFGQGSMIYLNNSQIYGLSFGGGYQAATEFTPLQGVRFSWSSGAWSTGVLRLYGIKNS